jgi:hypothetical protein
LVFCGDLHRSCLHSNRVWQGPSKYRSCPLICQFRSTWCDSYSWWFACAGWFLTANLRWSARIGSGGGGVGFSSRKLSFYEILSRVTVPS